jgi:hypothetical protein
MAYRKVIAYQNKPTTFPIGATVVGWLLLDRLHAPGVVWGAAGVVFVCWWIISAFAIFKAEKQVDLFPEEKKNA